jgi:hypothetical protein
MELDGRAERIDRCRIHSQEVCHFPVIRWGFQSLTLSSACSLDAYGSVRVLISASTSRRLMNGHIVSKHSILLTGLLVRKVGDRCHRLILIGMTVGLQYGRLWSRRM